MDTPKPHVWIPNSDLRYLTGLTESRERRYASARLPGHYREFDEADVTEYVPLDELVEARARLDLERLGVAAAVAAERARIRARVHAVQPFIVDNGHPVAMLVSDALDAIDAKEPR